MNRLVRRSRLGFDILAAVCLLAALPASSQARPGDLDPGFSTDGLEQVSLNRGAHAGTPSTAWVVPLGYAQDGDLVVAGETVYTGSYGLGRPIPPPTYHYLAIGHVRPDGMLDPSFGSDGAVEHELMPRGPRSVALTDDGRVVAIGQGYPHMVVARFLPNGEADPSFSEDGIAAVPVNADLTGIAVQDDGRVVVGGASPPYGAETDPVVARLLDNGDLDPAFGQDGVWTASVGDADQITAIRIDSQDRLVLAGTAGGPPDVGNAQLLVARLLPTGVPDPSFSGDGYATFDLVPDEPVRHSVLGFELDSLGRPTALVDSYLMAPAVDRRHIVRLTDSGNLDPSFGAGGARALERDVTSLSIQGDGRLVLAGTSVQELVGGQALVIGRLLADGSSDPGFGRDGWAIDYPFPELSVTGLITKDDRGILGGWTWSASGAVGAIGRFRLDDGPPDDADADGVHDPGDQCPGVYAPAEGCPSFSRDITLKRRPKPGRRWRGSIGGTISTDRSLCLDAEVLVYRKQHGPDPLIRTVDADGRPLWYTARSGRIARGGEFYARIEGSFDPAIGYCAAAGSKTVDIPPRSS